MTGPDDVRGDPTVNPVLAARVRAEIDNVPSATAERLRLIRQAAVKELDTRQQSPLSTWWVAGGFAATAASVALVTTILLPGTPVNEPELPVLTADEMAVVQSMEVLEELEFLAWMEEEANRAVAG